MLICEKCYWIIEGALISRPCQANKIPADVGESCDSYKPGYRELEEQLAKAQAGAVNDLAQQLTMVVLKYELLVGLLVDAGEDPAEYGLTWPQEQGNEWINAPLEKAWYMSLDYAISKRFVTGLREAK